jgi:hypothetical protein
LSISPAGILIDGGPGKLFRITGTSGVIDLSYLAGEESNALPPLVLRNCILDGELRIAGSHFGVLEVSDCEISRIDGDYCRIDNYCRLANLSPFGRGRNAVAQVRLVGATIDGTADLRGCRLASPPLDLRSQGVRTFANRYALSLASCRIAGRLLMDDHFSARGGVSLYQASIGSSLSLGTARLESRDISIPALDGEELQLKGSLNWINPTPAQEPQDWHVSGRVVLRRASIGGECKLENCRWSRDGSVSLSGEALDHISGGIDLRHARIEGQLRIENGCSIARWVAPPSGRMTEDIGSCAFGASIDAWKAIIGKGIRVESEAVLHGPVLLNDSEIRHGIIMRGTVLLPRPDVAIRTVAEAVDLSNARLSGLVRFDARLSGSLNLRRGRVDGDVELHYLSFTCPPFSLGHAAQDRKTGCASLLDLNSLSVTGGLHIGRLAFDWIPLDGANHDDHRASRLAGLIHSLGRWCDRFRAKRWWHRLGPIWRRTRNLWSPVATLPWEGNGPAVTAAGPRPLRLKEGLHLLVGPGNCPLEGQRGDLDFMADTSRLPRTEGEAKALARLYLENIFDDRGRHSEVEIGPATRSTPDEWLIRRCEYSSPAGRYRLDVEIAKGSKQRSASPISVRPIDERQIPSAGRMHDAPGYRVGPFVLEPELLTDAAPNFGPSSGIPAAIEAYLRDRRFRPVLIDLRGLTCRRFDDDRARVWVDLGPQRWWRLLLEGIDFVHFDQSNPKARSKSAWAPPAPTADRDRPEGADGTAHAARRLQMLKAFMDPEKARLREVLRARGLGGVLDREARRSVRRQWFSEHSYLTSTDDYAPQPFETFARAYFRDGERNLAIEVARQRAKLRWSRAGHTGWAWIKRRPLISVGLCVVLALISTYIMSRVPEKSGLVRDTTNTVAEFLQINEILSVLPEVSRPFVLMLLLLSVILPLISRYGPPLVGGLFELTFGFGLRPRQAVVTMLVILFVGALGANNLPGLSPISEIRPDGSLMTKRAATKITPAAPAATERATADEVATEGCNVAKDDDVDKALYAFDVFIPLLDIRQECAFTIAKEADLLRALRAFYAALGWVVVSLTILTFSGVLRRDLEA